MSAPPWWRSDATNIPSLIHSCPITCAGFHALLNSLFKVLFNFPSWYLFAIGIVLYLAFDGVYHRIWTAFSNNPTRGTPPEQTALFERALHPLWDKCHNHVDFEQQQWAVRNEPHTTFPQYKYCRIRFWASPFSLAATRGIFVNFFSSAYWYA